MEEQGLVLSNNNQALALCGTPEDALDQASKAAKALMSVVNQKERKLVFNGKTYLQFEDWQTLGRFYGVTAVVKSTKYVEFGEVKGFEAVADAVLVTTNQVISSAEALCLDDERNWQGKPIFQLKSMAQTRACAKALRNVLAWIAVIAGYAATPAEEMDSETTEAHTESPQPQSHPPTKASRKITAKQASRLWAIGFNAKRSKDQIVELLGKYGYLSADQVQEKDYEAICSILAEQPKT